MAMRLSLEIPTSMLARWSPLIDLDFVLAHKVLADEQYASFFANRTKGRELILDNSTHEFAIKNAEGQYVGGTPLPHADLLKAAEMVRADIVIAPDIVNPFIDDKQIEQNRQWLVEFCNFMPNGYSIGSVLCGHTREDRDFYCFNAMGRSGVMCFTFHEPERLAWWNDFTDHPDFEWWDRVHILGVSTLDEMKKWFSISEAYPEINFSIDTTKAVKWGAQEKRIDELESLRGGPIDAKAVLEIKEFSLAQIDCVEYNIEVLKKICTGK